jgi:RND superfamily putative drug exporter
MVEARDSGTSTGDAIRIGTATTGRLITAAALVLAVVAGAFVFSDLVMMKYLAFGLVTALVLDATVVRMFLVPAVMKLLGDECWWAPTSLKRLHKLIGLGEIGLPDERKPGAEPESGPVPEPEPEDALVGAVAPATQWQPHDPTRPAAEGSTVQDVGARPTSTPSLASTTPMPSVNDPTAAQVSTANNPETNGDGHIESRAIPAQLQQDPDAT